MAIKKNDLVKQFELLVKQEMKNYQDSKLATNLAINSLRESIENLSSKVDSNHCKLESELNLQNSEHHRLENAFHQFREWKNSQDRDLVADMDKNFSELSMILDKLKCCFKNEDKVNEAILSLSGLRQDCENKDQFLEYQFNLEIQRLKRYFHESLRLQKKEILEMPSEAEAVKKDLSEKMEVQNVDFEGVYRELSIYKKTLYVAEKNIENLYNLIKKLKD